MKRNVYIMYIISLLQGMVFYAPIATLYRTAQGLSVFQITITESLFFILCLLMEIPWGIIVDGVKVHPTFLYESIWDVLIFIFLWIFRKKKKYEGQIIVYYIGLYSLGRFFIEGLRTDSLMIGQLRMAQVISLVGVIGAIIVHIYLSKKENKKTREEKQGEN